MSNLPCMVHNSQIILNKLTPCNHALVRRQPPRCGLKKKRIFLIMSLRMGRQQLKSLASAKWTIFIVLFQSVKECVAITPYLLLSSFVHPSHYNELWTWPFLAIIFMQPSCIKTARTSKHILRLIIIMHMRPIRRFPLPHSSTCFPLPFSASSDC